MRSRRLLLSLAPLAMVALLTACDSTNAPTVWTPASADPAVVSLTKTTFAPTSGVTDAVLAECGLDRKIPQEIAAQTPVPVVLAETPDGGARVLNLQVVHIFAPGGGAWSGPKSMTMHGDLVQGGQVVASFDVRRTTTRGGRTCEMLDYIVDAMGKDIREWLASPTLNAKLGEA
jgi:hypothetical protein